MLVASSDRGLVTRYFGFKAAGVLELSLFLDTHPPETAHMMRIQGSSVRIQGLQPRVARREAAAQGELPQGEFPFPPTVSLLVCVTDTLTFS